MSAGFSKLLPVRGQTSYDQDYIDGNVEAGVGGCGWKRPAARPPELDARPKAAGPAAHKKPKKKPGFLARVKARVTGKPVAPVPHIVAPPPAPIVVEPPPAPALRDPVYELLGVEGRTITSGERREPACLRMGMLEWRQPGNCPAGKSARPPA